ncbi:MAG: FAD-dependent oxidoreductase [Acidimicrobiales bacterium]
MDEVPATDRVPLFDAGSDRLAFPVLDQVLLDGIAEFGSERSLAAGEVLYRPGEARWDFFVVLGGGVEVVGGDGAEETVYVSYGPGQFIGELGLVTGQRTYLTARAAGPGRVLAVPHEAFRRLMATRPTISDVIFRALVARREALRTNPAVVAVQIIGSRYSPESMALRNFAARNRLACQWIDLEAADDVGHLLESMGLRAGDTPVVVTASAVLRHPTPGEFAELLGLTYQPIPGRVFDLVVVGVGPAGLAASVYGASEGLDTVSLDAVGPGGQAGASSRIENYAGFPNGISGADLTAATAVQAQRLGAWLVSPCEVAGLRIEAGFHVVQLVDQSEIPCRSVLIATGARYQRLAVSDLGRFEGNGVYYAATDLEARSCAGSEVIVVGGGNSAGQASIYLSQQGCRVQIVVRRPDLSHSMSRYLIDRIEADPAIEVVNETEVRALEGGGHLERVVLVHTPSGRTRTVNCMALFCFIGAQPATSWLADTVLLDPKGFVLTDRALSREVLTDAVFASREPLPFETSAPGVFAAGDVRSGSMKRVASAVGEGSSAVRSVHDYVALGA